MAGKLVFTSTHLTTVAGKLVTTSTHLTTVAGKLVSTSTHLTTVAGMLVFPISSSLNSHLDEREMGGGGEKRA